MKLNSGWIIILWAHSLKFIRKYVQHEYVSILSTCYILWWKYFLTCDYKIYRRTFLCSLKGKHEKLNDNIRRMNIFISSYILNWLWKMYFSVKYNNKGLVINMTNLWLFFLATALLPCRIDNWAYWIKRRSR